VRRSRRVTAKHGNEKNDDIVVLTELIEAGKITPTLDRTCPLSRRQLRATPRRLNPIDLCRESRGV
jgi:hypothetical protein